MLDSSLCDKFENSDIYFISIYQECIDKLSNRVRMGVADKFLLRWLAIENLSIYRQDADLIGNADKILLEDWTRVTAPPDQLGFDFHNNLITKENYVIKNSVIDAKERFYNEFATYKIEYNPE